MRFRIRSLAAIAAVTAILLGVSMFLLRESATTRTSVPPRPNKVSVIMEGIDINSNGPGHPRPDPSSGKRRPLSPGRDRLLPPDILSERVP